MLYLIVFLDLIFHHHGDFFSYSVLYRTVIEFIEKEHKREEELI